MFGTLVRFHIYTLDTVHIAVDKAGGERID